MKRSYSTILCALACLALATTAWATDTKDESDPGNGNPQVQANCDLTGYKSEIQTVNATIPDNTVLGVNVGPIIVPADGSLIADVIIDINATHTWVGDLVAVVGYDETCDGAIDAQATVLCRPRGTNATANAPCGSGTGVGCSSNLIPANTLLFDDSAAAAVADGVCAGTSANIAAGCYKPSPNLGSPLAIFKNLRKGGCWFLNVSDRAVADLGTVNSWSVHIKNQTLIGVEAISWSAAKHLYN